MFRTTVGLLLPIVSLLAQAPPRQDQRGLGQQGYLFAYPLVLMDVTRETAQAVSNTFVHARQFPDDRFRAVVRPNSDTLYSNAWLDLSKEPVMLHVPDTHGRYYLMQILDAWTETVSVPGKRTTGTGEGWFAIVGPGWRGKLPDRVTRIDCPTNMAWIIGRTQTNGPLDYANVHKIQDGFELMPLSQYPDGVKARAQAATEARRTGQPPPPEAVNNMSNADFLNRFLRLLASNPAHEADQPMIVKLAQSGMRAGAPIEEKLREGFDAGIGQAKDFLAGAEKLRGMNLSSTKWSKPNPAVGRYGTNYIARAVVARIGLGANPPEDAVYLNCNLDATGAPLDGSRQYRMHFEKNQLPPVDAFWSITVYDPAGYFVSNSINRYAIGDRDKLNFNSDGSLDIWILALDPASANWLPAPKGPFVLSFRLYWPRPEAIMGVWTPPAVMPMP